MPNTTIDERLALSIQTAVQTTLGTLWERNMDRCEMTVDGWDITAQRLMRGYEVTVMVKNG